MSAKGHDHPADGGPPAAGLAQAENPTYPIDTEIIRTADHMPGMDGDKGMISDAFDTTAYSVSYALTNGRGQVIDHR